MSLLVNHTPDCTHEGGVGGGAGGEGGHRASKRVTEQETQRERERNSGDVTWLVHRREWQVTAGCLISLLVRGQPLGDEGGGYQGK